MSTIIQVNKHEAKSQLSQMAERKPGSLKGRIRIAPDFDTADADIAESMLASICKESDHE